MNSIELANKINELICNHYQTFGRKPRGIAIYVSQDQHMQLKNEIRERHYMDPRNVYEFMGYPLYPVYDTGNPHPDVRISIE